MILHIIDHRQHYYTVMTDLIFGLEVYNFKSKDYYSESLKPEVVSINKQQSK